ncbi:MAG TPA: hypothetical protein GX511_04940 [Firmicutes bacterium]|nr:hypothetical protein [Bacillota bacterium]
MVRCNLPSPKRTNGAILVEVLTAVAVLALLATPLTALALAGRHTARAAEQTALALTLAESSLEELLALKPESSQSQGFRPVDDRPAFERALEVIPAGNGLWEIRVSVRWGHGSKGEEIELVTLTTGKP